jgi:glutaredoxin-related protein
MRKCDKVCALGYGTMDTLFTGCVGLKVLNNWPTFPQIIVNGELVGGECKTMCPNMAIVQEI